jgi:transposase
VRVVWGGRGAVRRILYLAAVTAKTCNKDMSVFYRRLIDNGKQPKAALIAVARKLLVLANVLIAQDRLWLPTAPQNA